MLLSVSISQIVLINDIKYVFLPQNSDTDYEDMKYGEVPPMKYSVEHVYIGDLFDQI